MKRAAVLINEADVKLGKTDVPEATFVIRHGGATFVRTAEGVRLSGRGIGVAFRQTEVYIRERLEAI